MAWCRGRGRSGVSIIEVMISVVAGSILLVLIYAGLTTGSRILTRGQNKLVDTGQAELVFRWLRADVGCAAGTPVVDGGAPRPLKLTIPRWLEIGNGRPPEQRVVVWTFRGVGTGSVAERQVTGGGPPLRLCVGTLLRARVDETGDPAHPGLMVMLVMRTVHDATVALFEESFFVQNLVPDPYWNPLE